MTDPFLDQKHRPRIVVYWNTERLTIPWMDRRLLDHAHARVVGRYEIVEGKLLLLVHSQGQCIWDSNIRASVSGLCLPAPDLEGALIGPANNQNIPDVALVSVGPFEFEQAHWDDRRLLGNIDGIGEMSKW